MMHEMDETLRPKMGFEGLTFLSNPKATIQQIDDAKSSKKA